MIKLLFSGGALDATTIVVAWSGFQITVWKPIPKKLLRPITTGANRPVTKKTREKSSAQDAIGFGFDFY